MRARDDMAGLRRLIAGKVKHLNEENNLEIWFALDLSPGQNFKAL
jgi:hypothetical protein